MDLDIERVLDAAARTESHVHRWSYYDDSCAREDWDSPATLALLSPAMYEDPDPRGAPHRQCADCHVVEWAVPAITVQQPWAWAIAVGAKPVELRSRPTRWRGPLAIHAGTRWSLRGEADERVRTTGPLYPGGALYDHQESDDSECTRGAVIALTTLADCHPAAGCCPPWGDDSYDGKPVHHLVLNELRPVNQPVPMKGRLGVWVAYLPWPVTERHECDDCGEEYADALDGGLCRRLPCRIEADNRAIRAAAEVRS